LHGVVMLGEQARHFLIKLTDLLVGDAQFVQHHVQEAPVHPVECGAGADGVA
jgi:hypothetical protein